MTASLILKIEVPEAYLGPCQAYDGLFCKNS